MRKSISDNYSIVTFVDFGVMSLLFFSETKLGNKIRIDLAMPSISLI